MGMLKLDAMVHWSIPANNLEDSEKFYGEILGLEHVGRLATSRMSCFTLGGHNIILCERKEPIVRTVQQDGRLHHAFDIPRRCSTRPAKSSGSWASKFMSPLTIAPPVFSLADNCSFSIPAGIELNSEIPPGRRGCRHQPTRKSAIHKNLV
jgi:catechol 2,3-dioxygenase-like lactoylglutathione lyase family enzyme